MGASENNLGGSVGLDTTDFRKGVSELKNQIKNIETGFRASAITMENWGNTSNGLKERVNSLREEISKQKQEMEIYRQELQKVSSGSEADQKAADSLTNKMYSLQKQIGNNEKDFQKYNEQLSKVEKSENESASSTGKLGKSFMDMAEKSRQSTSKIKDHFSNLKSSIMGYLAGIVSAVSIKDIAESTDTAEKTMAQMDAVLKSTGGTAGMTKDQLLQLADSQSKVTTYSKGTTEQAENMLLTFTNVGSSVFPQAIKSAENMATAMGTSATDAAKTLGKALNDPTNGLSKLTKQGVTFTDEQKNQIKAMQASGDTAGAQMVILSELEKEFGGSAEAAGQTITGQIQIMENNVKSSGVQIMSALLPIATNLMPSIINGAQNLSNQIQAHKDQIVGAFTAVGNGVKNVFGWLESHGTIVKGVIIGITSAVVAWKIAIITANTVQAINNALTVAAAIKTGGLAAGEGALAAAKGSTTLATIVQSAATIRDTAASIAHAVATKAAAAAQWLFNAALNANPIGIVIALIAGLVAAMVVLFNNNKGFHDWVLNAWGAIQSFAETVVNGIKDAFNGALNGIQSAWSGITGFFGGIWSGIQGAFSSVGNWFGNVFNDAKQAIYENFSSSAVSDHFNSVWQSVKNTFSNLNPIQWGEDLINGIANGIRSAADNVKQAVGNVAQNIRDFLHFSVPDKGPLTDYESWMPDFMTGLAKGIDSSKYKVVSAMRNLATDMSINPALRMSYSGVTQAVPQMIDRSITKAPIININGPVNVQDKGSRSATLQQLQFLAEV